MTLTHKAADFHKNKSKMLGLSTWSRYNTIYSFRHFRSKVINNIRSILCEVESDEAEQVVVYDLDELVAEDKMMGRLACDNSNLTNDDQDFVNNNEANRLAIFIT